MYVVNIINSYVVIHPIWGIWENRVFWPLFYICFSSPRYFNKNNYLFMYEFILGSRFAEKQKKEWRKRQKCIFWWSIFFSKKKATKCLTLIFLLFSFVRNGKQFLRLFSVLQIEKKYFSFRVHFIRLNCFVAREMK